MQLSKQRTLCSCCTGSLYWRRRNGLHDTCLLKATTATEYCQKGKEEPKTVKMVIVFGDLSKLMEDQIPVAMQKNQTFISF